MLHNLEMKSTGGHYLLVYCGALEDLVKMYKLGTEYHTDTFKARAIMKHLLHNFEGSFQDLNMVSTTRELPSKSSWGIIKEPLRTSAEAHNLDPDLFTIGM